MQYTIENEYLRLTVDTHGAEAVSVVNKATGAENGSGAGTLAVWGRHAPILFPYTGKLTGGKMTPRAKSMPAASTALPAMWSTPWWARPRQA